MEQKKMLVTGGTGFIGGALVQRLLTDGHEVVVVDNMFDVTSRIMKVGNLGCFEMRSMDIRDMAGLRIDDIDTVFHCAAHYANERSLEEPLLAVDVNMVGTMAVLMFCLANGVKNLVYASSSGVYGGRDIVAYSESMQPKPATPYEVTKYGAELLCSGYGSIYGISVISPRFFNVYGVGDVPGKWRAAIPNFFKAALLGEKILVTGKKASRDFTYIDDVVDAVLAGVEYVRDAPDTIELCYNISTGKEVFISDVAKMVVELTGSDSEIEIVEPRHWDNALRRVGDSHKFRALFPAEYDKMSDLKEGLLRSLDWYKTVCK